MLAFKRLLSALFVGFALLTSAQVLAGENGKTFLYNITTDEAWPAGMATTQAYKASEAGHDVVIYLNVRGVYLAATNRKQDTLGATGRTAQENIRMAMEHGAQVIVCPMCLGQAGLTRNDLIEGTEPGSPDMLFKILSRDDLVTLSY